MKLAAIILAAGRSRRFGSADKLLAPFGDAPILRRTTIAVVRSGFFDIVVVTGMVNHERRSAVADLGVRFVTNPDADDGQAGSIAWGIAALAADCEGAMIVPADMPALTPGLLRQAIDAFVALHGERIVHFAIDGALRPPVIWPHALFEELMALRGDGGGKGIVARHARLAHAIDISADAAWRLDDIDTHDDLVALAARVQ
jgi:molybdenum cofactor cytidylyltransferase